MNTTTATRRIATYERVSSEDQRQRRTIQTQTEELAKHLQVEEGVHLVERYIDDGVSGTVPMAKRPAGRRLLEDAAKGNFDEVWVYRLDRLGRDDVDPLIVWRNLESLGVSVYSVTEGTSDPFMISIRVAVNAQERRTTLQRSADGMERIVKAGHFPGGICPLGYLVEGLRQEARLIPSSRIICGNWTAADLIRQIFQWLGVEHWSCPQIANHLNALGVPTAYQHLAPGRSRAERKTGLQAKWRAGRIRNLVILTVYKGVYQYGKRSKKREREIWEVPVPALVSNDLWKAAQETLARNRLIAKNTPRHYLLTGLIKCGGCGKTYCASLGRNNIVSWRCTGRMISRYGSDGRCQSKMIKGTAIESIIWKDIERWFREPGDLLKELEAELNQGKDAAVEKTEIITLEARLKELEQEKNGYHRQNAKGFLMDEELQDFLNELADSKAAVEKRLIELAPQEAVQESLPLDLLQELRRRLDGGLSEEQRQEIARLLVKRITIKTKGDDEKRHCEAEVTYRFNDAVNYDRGRGSWLRRA